VTAVRNRIKRHVCVKASELVAHELNPRTHSDAQRAALSALYAEVGFARSLLAYELPDGRLKLIDGHLRRDLDPDMEVEVEVLDVNDAEARALLLSIDPLARLAGTDLGVLDELRRLTTTTSAALAELWQSIGEAESATQAVLGRARRGDGIEDVPEQFLILVECADEQEQTDLLRRFQEQGLKCKALLS
jgi:ParB-like chromosome segregation protein Spo0J